LLDGTSFLLADSSDNRVRLVDSQGNIFTIAGTGDAGSSGNGVAPKTAELNAPSSVAVASDGSVIVADTNSHIVRRIFQGKIKTIAGIADQAGAGADGVAGTASKLNTPYAVAVSAGGQVLIADHLTQRVRVLASAYVPQ
jgi:DNA-binding beta-propeller fold protein YncE